MEANQKTLYVNTFKNDTNKYVIANKPAIIPENINNSSSNQKEGEIDFWLIYQLIIITKWI